MEGDPCSTYRSAEDATRATVIAVERDGDEVKFRAQLDDGSVIERSTHEVSPAKLWEVAPEYIAAFRAKVEGARGARRSSTAAAPAEEVDHEYRRAVESRLETFEERISHVEGMGDRVLSIKTEDDRFRSTMADTVRALAEDVIRQSEGKPMEFVWHYVDSYDKAVESRHDDPSTATADPPASATRTPERTRTRTTDTGTIATRARSTPATPTKPAPDALSES